MALVIKISKHWLSFKRSNHSKFETFLSFNGLTEACYCNIKRFQKEAFQTGSNLLREN